MKKKKTKAKAKSTSKKKTSAKSTRTKKAVAKTTRKKKTTAKPVSKKKTKAKKKLTSKAKKTSTRKKTSAKKKVRATGGRAKKTMAKPGEASPGRYIVCFNNDSRGSINKAQKALSMQLTSSKELCSTVRAHDIMQSGNGIHFKNLGIAVVDDIEAAQLQSAVMAADNPIVYWEPEREFTTDSELSKIQDIKVILEYLTEQVDELEEMIFNKDLQPVNPVNYTWGLREIGMEFSQFTGKGVNLCILDTGFYLKHPDFVGRNIEGRSFIRNQAWDKDKFGHGTHCAGTAGGGFSLEDGTRYGVASDANLFIGKVLNDRGSGSTSGIVDAIDWAIEKKCQIVSMSLGSRVKIGEKPSQIFEQAGRRALEQNTLLIAAAGNDSNRSRFAPKPVSAPANAESVLAVAALNEDLSVANFSNGGINASDGGRIDIAAPGVDVLSAYSKNARNGSLYTKMNGTSMATPHVAGVAALLAEAFPGISGAELWLKLEKRAKFLEGLLARDVGQGIVQSI